MTPSPSKTITYVARGQGPLGIAPPFKFYRVTTETRVEEIQPLPELARKKK